MAEWLRYFMFDTLSRIAFGEDLGFMVSREDIDGTLPQPNRDSTTDITG